MNYRKAVATGALQANLLAKTAKFLYHRYLGNESELLKLFSENVQAYGVIGATEVMRLLFEYDFSYPVVSIRANANRQCVHIEYEDDDCLITSEIIFFEGKFITSIETRFINNLITELLKRPSHCAGSQSNQSIRCLRSVRILEIGATFLSFDIKRDLGAQADFLTESTIAFGLIGKDAIIGAQLHGVETGIQYLVPFPLLINTEVDCISVDFYAIQPLNVSKSHDEGEDYIRQRGTDIMYIDLDTRSIQRIDTLRHTLNQPEWVKKHFNQ